MKKYSEMTNKELVKIHEKLVQKLQNLSGEIEIVSDFIATRLEEATKGKK